MRVDWRGAGRAEKQCRGKPAARSVNECRAWRALLAVRWPLAASRLAGTFPAPCTAHLSEAHDVTFRQQYQASGPRVRRRGLSSPSALPSQRAWRRASRGLGWRRSCRRCPLRRGGGSRRGGTAVAAWGMAGLVAKPARCTVALVPERPVALALCFVVMSLLPGYRRWAIPARRGGLGSSPPCPGCSAPQARHDAAGMAVYQPGDDGAGGTAGLRGQAQRAAVRMPASATSSCSVQRRLGASGPIRLDLDAAAPSPHRPAAESGAGTCRP